MNGPVDLRPDHLATVHDIVASYFPDAFVRVFGSRATWKAKPYSDLDLIVRSNRVMSAAMKHDMEEALSNSDLPMKVDILYGNGHRSDFLEMVESGSVSLPWPTRPLVSFVARNRSICYGIVQPGARISTGVPILRVNNFNGFGLDTTDAMRVAPSIEGQFRRSRLQGGELLVTLVGSVGLVAIAPPEVRGWNVARAIGVVPLEAGVDARWIAHVLRSKPAQDFIAMRSNTTVQTTFNLKDLAEIPIPMPPERVRRPMSDLLSALDDKIELNRRMNETLEASARALFRDWFVGFGPTRAKAEGRPAYLTPDLWSLFPDRLDDDGVPEGWRAGSLADVARPEVRKVNPTLVDVSMPYIGLEHMPRRSIALSDWESAGKVTSGKSEFSAGQILFGKLRPYFHKVGVAPVDGICSTDIVVLDGKREGDRAMVLTCVSSDEFVAFTDQGSTGTKMPRTSWATMSQYPMTLATDDVRRAFNAVVMPLIDRLIANVHESRSVATTRDALLPKLMSGEIRVRDAEALVAA